MPATAAGIRVLATWHTDVHISARVAAIHRFCEPSLNGSRSRPPHRAAPPSGGPAASAAPAARRPSGACGAGRALHAARAEARAALPQEQRASQGFGSSRLPGAGEGARALGSDRGTTFSIFAVPTIQGEFGAISAIARGRSNRREERRSSPCSSSKPATASDRSLVAAPRRRRSPPSWGEATRRCSTGSRPLRPGTRTSLDALLVDGDDETTTYAERIGAPDAGYATVEEGLVVDDLTRILDARAREVLRLRFRDDLLQSEIAERVGCSQM